MLRFDERLSNIYWDQNLFFVSKNFLLWKTFTLRKFGSGEPKIFERGGPRSVAYFVPGVKQRFWHPLTYDA